MMNIFRRPAGIWCRLAMMWLAGLLSVMAPPPTRSQVHAPPITPSGLNTHIGAPTTLPTGQINYDITGGTRPGNGANLFHSFGQFGVPTNNIANFLNEKVLPTSNILGRVTGGTPSNIFGTIQTSGFGSANLFLMNPAGILFGPNATLNIGGMATFTTADYLKLADGTRFHAMPNPVADGLLSAAPVATFGFLGPRSGPITVDHSTLQMPEGKGLALVGGQISIVGGRLITKGAPVELTGRESIVIAGTVQDGTTGVFASADSAGHPGHVTLSAPAVQLQMATLESSAGEIGSAGTVTIQGFGGPAAKTVSLDNATVRTTISGGSAASTPGHITITADSVTLSNGTLVTADTFGAAPAGDITFNVGSLTTIGGPNRINAHPEDTFTDPKLNEVGVLIASNSRGLSAEAGPAGTITIQGVNGPGSRANSVSLNDTNLSTKVFGGTADTRPASITITADLVALGTATDAVNLGHDVVIEAVTAGPAPAGNIALNVGTMRADVNPDGIPIKGAGGFTLNTQSQSRDRTAGPAGTVTISGPGPESTDAATLVALDKTGIITSVVGGTAATPPAGITITTKTLALTAETGTPAFDEVSGETGIFAASAGAAPAGHIAFHVDTLRANVNPDGTPMGHGYGFLGTFSQSRDSTAGPAGTITISGPGPGPTDAATLVALNNFSLNTDIAGGTAATVPSAVTITAHTLTFSGNIRTNELGLRTGILSSSSGGAPAGNVVLNVDTLSTSNTNFSSSSTSAAVNAGNAGRITVQGVAGPGSLPTTVMLNQTDIATEANAGAGGSIALASATDILLTDSTISAAVTGGSQPGGHITLSAGNHITITDGSVISARSIGLGNAGNILINAGQNFSSTHSAVTTQASHASGGNITVTASDLIELTNSQINASVQGSTTTTGGNITIDPQFVILQNSQILAQATQGQGGNISITTNALVSDATSLVDASSQFGVNGTLRIQSPNAPAAGKIVPLSKTTLATAPLLSQRCAAMASGQYSSFVVAGHYGMPTEPGGWLVSPLAVLGAGPGHRTGGEEQEGPNAASLRTNETEILSLRGLRSSDTVANIFLTDWTAGCGS